MRLLSLIALSALAATPAIAQETRQLDSHEHGVGQLDIAIDGTQVALELHAPGADIVGFEYSAESTEDLAKIEAALLVLAQPLDLFVLPEATQCEVVEAHVELEGGDDHEGEDGHADDAVHTQFHAEYLLNCEDVASLSEISFAYFTAFPNALEVEVQVVSDAGATAFEVERDAPLINLSEQ